MESYIARQPILDQTLKVYGYELLFRNGFDNVVGSTNLTHASSKVIADGFLLVGLERLKTGKTAFINVTEDVLVNDFVQMLPHERTVVELMETIEANPWTVEACRRLKRAGCVLALDDFTFSDGPDDLLELADIIKVDVLETPRDEREAMARRFRGTGRKLVAEKVETQEMFEETHEMGYDLFQGYFFCRPRTVAAPDVPAYKLHHFQVLQEIHRAELDLERIETILKHEPSVCYKLLRYINSAQFGWRAEVNSVRRPLVLLGERESRKWASLMILANIAQDKPSETLLHAVTRGRFCETLGGNGSLRDRTDDLFLVGVFSLLDAMLDRPLGEIVPEIAVHDDVRSALMGNRGCLGDVLRFVRTYERADWAELAKLESPAGVDPSVVPSVLVDALDWGARTFLAASAAREHREPGGATA